MDTVFYAINTKDNIAAVQQAFLSHITKAQIQLETLTKTEALYILEELVKEVVEGCIGYKPHFNYLDLPLVIMTDVVNNGEVIERFINSPEIDQIVRTLGSLISPYFGDNPNREVKIVHIGGDIGLLIGRDIRIKEWERGKGYFANGDVKVTVSLDRHIRVILRKLRLMTGTDVFNALNIPYIISCHVCLSLPNVFTQQGRKPDGYLTVKDKQLLLANGIINESEFVIRQVLSGIDKLAEIVPEAILQSSKKFYEVSSGKTWLTYHCSNNSYSDYITESGDNIYALLYADRDGEYLTSEERDEIDSYINRSNLSGLQIY